MPRFVIERDVPGVSDLTSEQLAAIARSCDLAVASLGVPHAWVTTYVAGDKLYCVHDAEDAEAVLEHARRAGLPAHAVTEVTAQLGPDRGETSAL